MLIFLTKWRAKGRNKVGVEHQPVGIKIVALPTLLGGEIPVFPYHPSYQIMEKRPRGFIPTRAGVISGLPGTRKKWNPTQKGNLKSVVGGSTADGPKMKDVEKLAVCPSKLVVGRLRTFLLKWSLFRDMLFIFGG